VSNLTYLFQRLFASSCLDLVKLKAFVPCTVEDKANNYQTTITRIVFEPLKIKEVNAEFAAAGYFIPEEFSVIAVTGDDTILLWGGLNSVYDLHPGEKLDDSGEVNLAFNDIVDLTGPFKIENTKAEIDDLVEQLKETYVKP
jgi:hypothetical protein